MTLSALGIFSAAGAGPVAPASSYELISTTILGANSTLVDLTGLNAYSADYRHLQIRFTAKNSSTGSQQLNVRFNNVATNTYAYHQLGSTGTTVTSASVTSNASIPLDSGMSLTTTASAFAGGIIDILDVYSTTKNKTIRCLSGNVDSTTRIYLHSGFLNATTAISSIQFIPNANQIATGSRFSLYGIKG